MNKLIDRYGRHIQYVRVSLTEACNFACPYCRPAGLDMTGLANILTVEEWMPILRGLREVGIKAIRLTGGEPLLYPYVEELLHAITLERLFEDISLTTNGSLLEQKATALYQSGLQRVNVSLDALTESQFLEATGGYGSWDAVKKGIFAACKAGLAPVKVNTVLSKAISVEEVRVFLNTIRTWPVIWRFIEYMPFQGNTFRGPTFEEWKATLEEAAGEELTSVSASVGYGPASYYAFPDGFRIGFIFPMSRPYCDDCNRLRITAEGSLRLCLLKENEVPLRYPFEKTTPILVKERIEEAVKGKKEHHDGYDSVPGKDMFKIGG